MIQQPITPPSSDMGALDLAATLAVTAYRWEDMILDAELRADALRKGWALNQELRWDRMDREMGL